jgi:hypothetical protein
VGKFEVKQEGAIMKNKCPPKMGEKKANREGDIMKN